MKTLESLESFMISDSISDRLDAASFSEDGGGASSSEIFCHFTMSSGSKAKCRVVVLKIKPEKIFTIRVKAPVEMIAPMISGEEIYQMA